jgi:hypothetical protein
MGLRIRRLLPGRGVESPHYRRSIAGESAEMPTDVGFDATDGALKLAEKRQPD